MGVLDPMSDEQEVLKLWCSDGKTLLGPIAAREVKLHPNNTMTVQVTDRAWLDKEGWGKECYVEVQANPMPVDRKVPARDVHFWELVDDATA